MTPRCSVPGCKREAEVTLLLYRLPMGKFESPPIRLPAKCRGHADYLLAAGNGYITEAAP